MHYSLIVFGQDFETQLEKFQCFEVDCKETPYVQEIDVTDEARSWVVKERQRKGLSESYTDDELVAYAHDYYDYSVLKDESEIERDGRDQTGWILAKANQPPVVITRTNPNSRFDYYSVGGRWTNFYPHEDGFICQGTKTQINLPLVEQAIREKYEAVWAKYMSLLPSMNIKEGEQPWSTMTDISKALNLTKYTDVSREWLSQSNLAETMNKFSTDEVFSLDLDLFILGHDKFIQFFVDRMISTKAMFFNNTWEEFDEGRDWWKMNRVYEIQHEWANKIRHAFEQVSDDTLISILDCHD